jgi:8-oxo-dGTP diphosphatase
MTEIARKHLAYCWIARGDRVLFLRRGPGVFLAGRWELPGGTAEPGESLPRVRRRSSVAGREKSGHAPDITEHTCEDHR